MGNEGGKLGIEVGWKEGRRAERPEEPSGGGSRPAGRGVANPLKPRGRRESRSGRNRGRGGFGGRSVGERGAPIGRAREGGRLTTQPDEQARGSAERGSMRAGRPGRDHGGPGPARRSGGRSPLVIAAIEAVDPLLRGRGATRLREPEPGRPDRFRPLEARVTRARGRAELRALRGRDEDRPHDQDREHGSDELRRHGLSPIAFRTRELLFTNRRQRPRQANKRRIRDNR
jgi:hypothetical protein